MEFDGLSRADEIADKNGLSTARDAARIAARRLDELGRS